MVPTGVATRAVTPLTSVTAAAAVLSTLPAPVVARAISHD